MPHAEATDHLLVRKVLVDIANEERVHLGEFGRLLQILTGDEDDWIAKGHSEVDEISKGMTASAQIHAADSSKETEHATIGSLKE
jgi:rubrerythrin